MKIQEIRSQMGTRISKIGWAMSEIIEPKVGNPKNTVSRFSSSLIKIRSDGRPLLREEHQYWKFLCLSCCKFPEFFKTPPTFLIGMVLTGVMDKNPQKSEIRKYAILTQPRNLTFFEDEIFQLFSYLYGPKVPKWNFAHILLWKKAKNIRKTPKNTWFTAPWLRTTLLNDTV